MILFITETFTRLLRREKDYKGNNTLEKSSSVIPLSFLADTNLTGMLLVKKMKQLV